MESKRRKMRGKPEVGANRLLAVCHRVTAAAAAATVVGLCRTDNMAGPFVCCNLCWAIK